MPTYEYKCAKCGVFEQKQSIKDEALKNCPTCNEAVKRLISRNVGVIYKGSGFYTTDSKPKIAESKPNTTDSEPKTEKNEPKSEKNEPKIDEKAPREGSDKSGRGSCPSAS